MPTTAIPVKDLKNTAKICETVRESDGPILVTRNGYAEMVVMKPEEYEALHRAKVEQEIIDAIAAAEERMDNGEYVDLSEDIERWRVQYGI